MELPTPPPTVRNSNGFMEPANKLSYYEDLYGLRNEDEEFDRHADDCEDETDTDNDNEGHSRKVNSQAAFFARFTTPRPVPKEPFVQAGFGRYGEIRPNQAFEADRNTFNNSQEPITPSRHRTNNQQYNNYPSLKRKHPAPANQNKKLTPKKYGIFSSSCSMQGTNTAGETMDDLLRAGGGLESIDDDFPTLEQDSEEEIEVIPARHEKPDIDPALLAGDRKRAKRQEQSKVERANIQQAGTNIQAASDGDVEDNTSDVNEAQDAIRAIRQKGKPGLTSANAKMAIKSSRPTTSGKSKVQKAETSTPSRYSTRNREKVVEQNIPTRPLSRKGSTVKAAELKTRTKRSTTARAATLHKKAKKKGVAGNFHDGRVGKNVRLRNWMGNVIKEDDGFVVVLTDEEDAQEYTRYSAEGKAKAIVMK